MAKAKKNVSTSEQAGGGAAAMQPYADDSATMTIGGFSAENSATCVSLSGSLDLTKDKAGLEKARQLKALLDAVVAALEGAGDMTEAAAKDTKPAKTVKNPFE